MQGAQDQPDPVLQLIGKWIEEDYNKFYVHSELGYLSPEEFEARYASEMMRKAA